MFIRIKCTDEYRSQSYYLIKIELLILNDTCNHIIDILTVIKDEFSDLTDKDAPFQD